jgi:alpha-glucosidase
VAVFGGSAWTWNAQRQQFYLHQFTVEQPDLNFENIDVRNEMLAMIKFWLDTGVEGFRVDAVPHIYEDQQFLDEPENPNRDPASRPDEHRYYDHIYTFNLPGVLVFLAKIRQLLDIYTKADGKLRCMMVESSVSDEYIMDYYGTRDKPVAHFPFNFHLLNVRPEQNASQVLKEVDIWYELMPEGEWGSFLTGNHDQKRAPTRWTEGGIDAANIINLLLQGTAVTYQGEEIGMTDTFLTWEETVDPQACYTDPERYEQFSRDPARTPFQWDNTTSAGFSTNATTWLPLNKNYTTVNLAAQEAAEESHIKVYKELLKLRQTDTWRYGSYESQALNSDRVLAFTRIPEDSNASGYLVLVNMSEDTVVADARSFARVPSLGVVRVRSVGFSNSRAEIGSAINTQDVELGPRNSIVIEFPPL